jgi:antitoxin YefM
MVATRTAGAGRQNGCYASEGQGHTGQLSGKRRAGADHRPAGRFYQSEDHRYRDASWPTAGGETRILVMKTSSLADVKAKFSAVVDEVVRTHEQVTVTRNGEPVVVIIAAEDLESLNETLALLADPEGRRRLEEARDEVHRGEFVTGDAMARLMEERRRREADE